MTTTVTSGMLIAGTYEVEQLINRGGMGEVYRGRNIHTGDPVAMKIVLPALAHDPMIEALFQKEAKVLGRLAHDAIVRYHTYMNPPEIGRPSLIMEFVEGQALGDRIKEGPMPEADVRVLMTRLASGLDRAHGAGVVHRDLSPDNVILEGGRVEHAKLIDFGIAKSSMKGDRTLLQGQFAGKFSFVAPEQLGAYDGNIDARSDIYSLALLMVAASQGKTVNMGGNMVEAVRSRSKVPDLSETYDDLRPLFAHMLQPNPANRPASMATVIEMLEDPSLIPDPASYAEEPDPDRTIIASQLPISSTGPQTQKPKGEFVGIPGKTAAPKPNEPPKKPGKGGMIAVALVALVAIGGGGAYFGGMFDPTPAPGPEKPAETSGQTPATDTAAAEKAAKEAAEKAAATAAEETAAKVAETEAARVAAEAAATADAARIAAETARQTKAAEDAKAAADAKAAEEAAAKAAAAEQNAAQPLDAISQQVKWVSSYDAGPCVYFSMLSSTGGQVDVEGYGTEVAPFQVMVDKFKADNGVEPNVGVRLINSTQCPVLDFMNSLRNNRGIAPSLILDNSTDVLKSGETVSGRIEGLAGRAVSLFLVNGAGGATNLKPWLSRASDGTLGFSFTVNLAAGAEPTPQLILAVVTERAVEKLDAVPNGVTARALVPFMQSELDRERQTAIGALRYFRLEN
ncbi:serine/threonine-protein kinase [Pseudorhodobacter sp.]|uniref:serine/threonine-protein kinase n=1 Tax=Pseudorhodobacter sp. TaxID=1934400 RepID=UPI00264721E4|nr:serine/threonine-protein kinase [Pseudorhodobacter sp.]MDN5787820.1 serine/threonine protein kinase [Pseudorhodobacter sp.]